MPSISGINSASRMQRAIQQSPIPEMITDLAAGNITPVFSTGELRMRYRKDRISEAEAKTCMTHACRAHAAAVGSVLVVTDDAGKICFGYVPDPLLETDDPEMATAFHHLGKTIDAGHAAGIVAARPTTDTSLSVECPVFVMPAFEYERAHGQAVEAFGTYLTSFRITVARPTASSTPSG
ncbi:hypothetical protein [Hoeflea sp.]|uniref:hypothetical protein n=1 Tax=Hoeflea sp. TaxID=1940281 RepID=UPI003A8D30B5